jgi:hypothetical protein
MSNIADDIVESIEIKPTFKKNVAKWGIWLIVLLINGAFVLGGVKISNQIKFNNLEESISTANKAIDVVKTDNEKKITETKTEIYNVFYRYQKYRDEQLYLIIDYHNSDPELLRKMLQVNSEAFNVNEEIHITN